LANALCAGRTLTCDAQLEQKIAALSPQEVVAGLRRRLDWNKMKVVKAGDLAGKTSASTSVTVSDWSRSKRRTRC
jgi:zinc protease